MTERRGIRNSRFLAVLLKYFARMHIWAYRREPRTTPTLYLRDGDR
jgi:F420H(2)-dependent quinone reductase